MKGAVSLDLFFDFIGLHGEIGLPFGGGIGGDLIVDCQRDAIAHLLSPSRRTRSRDRQPDRRLIESFLEV
jgi:hypothetical protein